MKIKNKIFISLILFSILIIELCFPTQNVLATEDPRNDVAKLNGVQRVHFINVKDAGNCTLIQTTTNNNTPIFGLVDTGRAKTFKDIESYLDKANVKRLEFLIITHSHGDHIGGAIKVMKKYKPKVLYIKDISQNSNDPTAIKYYNLTIDAAEEYGIPVKNITAPESYNNINIKNRKELKNKINSSNNNIIKSNLKFKFGKCTITVYNGKNWTKTTSLFNKYSENMNSLAVLVEYNIKLDKTNTKKFSILLSSDLCQPEIEEAITEEVGEVTIWQIAHHGYFNSFSIYTKQYNEEKNKVTMKLAQRIMKNLNPEYAIATTSYKRLLDSYARIDKHAKNGINTDQQFSNYSISLLANMKNLHINSSNAKNRIIFTGGWNDTAYSTVSGTSPNTEAFLNSNKIKNATPYVTTVRNTLGTNKVTPGSATFSFSYGYIKLSRNIMGTDF